MATQDTENRQRSQLWLVEFYRSSLGKKYAMALSGIVIMVYVFLHMLGNLKLYFGPEAMNEYADFLGYFGAPALPESTILWLVRIGLLTAFLVHIHAAATLWWRNRQARPTHYQSKRDWIAADFASRTMRWTGIIVLLFVVFHLADLTFGYANPDFERHDVYGNVVASFQRVPVSLFYLAANLALGFHLYHGAWSLFQSMGWNRRGFNHWRRYFAVAFAAVVVIGNLSFPLAVMVGIVS